MQSVSQAVSQSINHQGVKERDRQGDGDKDFVSRHPSLAQTLSSLQQWTLPGLALR